MFGILNFVILIIYHYFVFCEFVICEAFDLGLHFSRFQRIDLDFDPANLFEN